MTKHEPKPLPASEGTWHEKANDFSYPIIPPHMRYIRVEVSKQRSVIATLGSRDVRNITGETDLITGAACYVACRYDVISKPLTHKDAGRLLMWILAEQADKVKEMPAEFAAMMVDGWR